MKNGEPGKLSQFQQLVSVYGFLYDVAFFDTQFFFIQKVGLCLLFLCLFGKIFSTYFLESSPKPETTVPAKQ